MPSYIAEARAHYEKALAAGIRRGGMPALLGDALAADAVTAPPEYPLGVLQIPLEQVAGVCSESRRSSFSAGFYPLLRPDTEFASKWIELCRAHLEEGIRTPILAVEYMNRYYVREGNKRVSVLKYFDAVTVTAEVVRIAPPLSSREDVRVNYEYFDFFQHTGINYIYFRQPGGFSRLLRLVGKPAFTPWSAEDRSEFSSVYTLFRQEFGRIFGERSYVDVSTAFLLFITIFEYDSLKSCSAGGMREMLAKSAPELRSLLAGMPADLRLDPAGEKQNLLRTILPLPAPELKAAFIYSQRPEDSAWAFAHETGRKHAETALAGKAKTQACTVPADGSVSDVIEQAIGSGAKVIFTTSPVFLKESMRAAVNHPEIKILNCSLNKPQKAVRTYYARMYEARFLMGAVAASVCRSGRIGFIADYPIYGTIAGINAFALGAQMVDPDVRIVLEWAKKDGVDLEGFLWDNGLSVVCGRDPDAGGQSDRRFGLYYIENGKVWNLAIPVWNWSVFYEKIMRSVLTGTWKADESKDLSGVSYWWGMSSGLVGLIWSRQLPAGTQKLIRTLREDIIRGSLAPFAGPLTSQDGALVLDSRGTLKPGEIITMNWLASNVEGSIPETSALSPAARILADFQGVRTEENIL